MGYSFGQWTTKLVLQLGQKSSIQFHKILMVVFSNAHLVLPVIIFIGYTL